MLFLIAAYLVSISVCITESRKRSSTRLLAKNANTDQVKLAQSSLRVSDKFKNQMENQFKAMDKNGDGYLTESEAVESFTQHGWTEKNARTFFKKVNHGKKYNFNQLISYYKNK